MPVHLTKHHGLGNDFLVHLTDDPHAVADHDLWADRARAWCDRHRGIGADGLLLGTYGGGDADLVMTLHNADGSLAEMSGNGIRCLAQAEAMRRDQTSGSLQILTAGGRRTVTFAADPTSRPETLVASVEMGPAKPGPDPDGDPVAPTGVVVDPVAAALAPQHAGTYDLGNPHLVLHVDDVAAVDIAVAGPIHEARFAGGMNVHVVAPTPGEPDAITMVVWERGVGLTEACGTGATAVARAAHDWGLVGPSVVVHMPGGSVRVDVADEMVLHGPSVFIASIDVPA